MLAADDFGAFFHEVHGYPPFPWQRRLLAQVAANGAWPGTLDLPTGSGKTAAIDVAVFHLALDADRLAERRAPIRIAFVVDRRLVVDDAFARARTLQRALASPAGEVTARVAERLRALSGDAPPLIARRLRGGIPREDDWARTPAQPTVLCSTVDQVGSRLLFRGYGVSDRMKPVHAGLIGSDCLILLDEGHLAEPFRQTMERIGVYRGPNWRDATTTAPWRFVVLTATPGEVDGSFVLDQADRSNATLKRRLAAEKPTHLVAPAKSKRQAEGTADTDDADDDRGGGAKEHMRRVAAIVDQVEKAIEHFKASSHGATRPAIGVVANRVGRARAVFERLQQAFPATAEGDGAGERSADIILMIGPARPVDRDDLVEQLTPIRTRVWAEGESRALDKPLILVATQCIEAGVDIDLDALITEAAPLDSLRQRFGRLNRAGRKIVPYAAIVADRSDISARADDAVYGTAIKAAWNYLNEWARQGAVDFGIDSVQARIDAAPPPNAALTEKPDAPVLLPAHLDLLSETSPVPAADPDVGLYLHGAGRQLSSISVVWRADIDPEWERQGLVRLLTLVPPRSREAIELPVWTVKRWLGGRGKLAADVADVAAREAGEAQDRKTRRVFRWNGDDERSRWIDASELRPGDTVIVPASYGGVDSFGWNPECTNAAADMAHEAAEAFARKRFAVRVAPGLLDPGSGDATLARALASVRTEHWETVRQTLLGLDLPLKIKQALERLGGAKGRRGRPRVVADFDIYGANENGEPRGVVLLAPFGIEVEAMPDGGDGGEDGRPNSTEDDAAGLIFDFPLALHEHIRDVEGKTKEFVDRVGLPQARAADLILAAALHDLGKRDPRFQAWMHFGDPLGFDDDDESNVLAKSGRVLPPAAREKAGLPDGWRHEALSVRLARTDPRLAQAHDPDLVLWLVGSHHGYGRPLFPHRDPAEKAPNVGPQSLAFDWNGLDWPSLFARLKARYGAWELARMEAILRLADHRASEAARHRAAGERGA